MDDLDYIDDAGEHSTLDVLGPLPFLYLFGMLVEILYQVVDNILLN